MPFSSLLLYTTAKRRNAGGYRRFFTFVRHYWRLLVNHAVTLLMPNFNLRGEACCLAHGHMRDSPDMDDALHGCHIRKNRQHNQCPDNSASQKPNSQYDDTFRTSQ